MDIVVEEGGSRELEQHRCRSSSQCDPPLNVPPIFQFSKMNVGVVSADSIGNYSTKAYSGLNDELNLGMEFENKQIAKNVMKQ